MQLRALIVDPNENTRSVLRNILLGVESVWLEAECSRYDFVVDIVEQSAVDVAVISLDSDFQTAIQVIQSLSARFPDVDVIGVGSQSDGPFILKAMRAGIKEFVAAPVQYDDMLGALDRLSRGRGSSDRGGPAPCKVYAFGGAHGGVGATSLAVNFACVLALDPSNAVVFVDLDLAMGDSDVVLDVIPDYTIADVIENIDRIDLPMLKRSLCQHASGLHMLPHPVKIEDSAVIQPDHLSRILALLRMAFTHIVIDLSKGFRSLDMAAIELADSVVVATQLDVSNLRNVVRLQLLLNETDGLIDKVQIVANRVGSDENEISIQRASETIGQPIHCQIPNDSRTMTGSRNNGVPLYEHAPKSKVYRAILEMAEFLENDSGDVDDSSPPPPPGRGPVPQAPFSPSRSGPSLSAAERFRRSK